MHKNILSENRYVTWFWIVVLGAFLIKTVLAIYVPLTGDEAYYATWGKFFRWGYYDHPPFLGWFLHPFVYFGLSNFWLRLPTILTTTIVGVVMFYLLRPYNVKKAALIAILFLISPISLFDVLITTDIPLILFSFL